MAIPTDVAQKADRIGQGYSRRVEEIKGNGDLNEDAKRRLMAEAYEAASAEMDAVRDGWTQATQARRKTLARDLFGASSVSGADAISMRDAADRAAQLESPDDAAALLRRADNSGDTVLTRAIAQHAFDQASGPFGDAWNGVLSAFAESRPHTADRINELAASSPSADVGGGVVDHFHFYLAKPE